MVREYLGILSSLSKRALNLLQRIQAADDETLIYEPGAGWWVGNGTAAGRDAYELLRAAAIRQVGGEPFDESFQRYEVNSRGQEFLKEQAAEAERESRDENDLAFREQPDSGK